MLSGGIFVLHFVLHDGLKRCFLSIFSGFHSRVPDGKTTPKPLYFKDYTKNPRPIRTGEMVLKAGLEPARLAAGDFKSPASAIPPFQQEALLYNTCFLLFWQGEICNEAG